MKQTSADFESDESIDPLPAFDHDSNCNVCGGTGWHDDVPCYAGVKLPTDTEATV